MAEIPRLWLELLGEGAHGIELPATGMLVVGASPERAGFVVPGQGIEDAHCAIGRTKEGELAIKDLGSRYGTLVNGQRIASARLKAGDQILLGARRLELRGPLASEQAPVAEPPASGPAELPQRIGGYRVERRIGRGAMGEVYLAVQESLRRPVALKVLAPRLAADRDFVHRFQAEARAAAALSHPNVVVVYDVGEAGGAHYLSMEYMAGGSLEQKLAASGPLSWKAVLGVLTDAAGGLSYAEARGIVHRDIKPANLMYSGTGTVKIADLGLAITLEQEGSEAGDGASEGRKVFGTPHFISPEQARGDPVDHRSDLYSLGATAYRLLSGRTPFEGGTTRDILRALQTETPRPLRELVANLPPELEALVARLMARDPRERFPSAGALRRECERLRLLAEHGTALTTRASRTQLWVGAALLVAVGGASVWFLLQRPPSVERGPLAGPDAEAPALDQPLDDGSFFSAGTREVPRQPDEEQALRERERAAGLELSSLSPFLPPSERLAALQRTAERYPGTEASAAARKEIESLEAGPTEEPASSATADLLEQARHSLAERARWPPAEGELPRPVDSLRAIAEFPALGLGYDFEKTRDALATEVITGSASRIREALAGAEERFRAGDFTPLRALLPEVVAALDGIEGLAGDPARTQELARLAEEARSRLGSLDLEEGLFRAAAEQETRIALAAALGSGSGLREELRALDLSAIESRLQRLPPELRSRPSAETLSREVRAARGALGGLVQEFSQGGWRRKNVLDPRTRKLREVRDVRPDGLVFGEDGELTPLPWREAPCDPEWWHLLFQGRLSRDWSPAETRGIVALLRLVGVARGAELARELLEPRGSGLLDPAEVEALKKAFDPALEWLATPSPELVEEAQAIRRESSAALLLSQALTAFQERRWTSAAAALERCLGEGGDSLLVGLLSDGSEWREVPSAPSGAGADPSRPGATEDGGGR